MKQAQLKTVKLRKNLNYHGKVHCSILAEDAIKAAIADYKNKQGK